MILVSSQRVSFAFILSRTQRILSELGGGREGVVGGRKGGGNFVVRRTFQTVVSVCLSVCVFTRVCVSVFADWCTL